MIPCYSPSEQNTTMFTMTDANLMIWFQFRVGYFCRETNIWNSNHNSGTWNQNSGDYIIILASKIQRWATWNYQNSGDTMINGKLPNKNAINTFSLWVISTAVKSVVHPLQTSRVYAQGLRHFSFGHCFTLFHKNGLRAASMSSLSARFFKVPGRVNGLFATLTRLTLGKRVPDLMPAKNDPWGALDPIFWKTDWKILSKDCAINACMLFWPYIGAADKLKSRICGDLTNVQTNIN